MSYLIFIQNFEWCKSKLYLPISIFSRHDCDIKEHIIWQRNLHNLVYLVQMCFSGTSIGYGFEDKQNLTTKENERK